MAREVRVSVIVPVFDDAPSLRRVLEALAGQELAADEFEVLVVDNGSAESVEPIVGDHPRARLLREATPGSYAARNLGAAEARGELLAFTDADCVPDRHWLTCGIQALERHEDEAFVGGAIELFVVDAASPSWAETYELALGFPQRKYVEQNHFAATANLFVSRAVFERVGAFDASLKSGGDREWGNRAQTKGIRAIYCPDAVVAHPARASLGQLMRKRARVVGGHLDAALARHSKWGAYVRVFAKDCSPPIARMLHKRALRNGTLAERAAYNARVFGVGTALQLFSMVEIARLASGGDPRR